MKIVKEFVKSVQNKEYENGSLYGLVLINRIKNENKLDHLKKYLEEQGLELSYSVSDESFHIKKVKDILQ